MTTYKEAGVDIASKNSLLRKIKAHISTNDSRVISGETLFKGLVVSATELKNYKEPVLAFNTDGVGTKTLIAAELDKWEGIGDDIVNHCINDILTMGAKPLCFSDYVAAGKLDSNVIERIVKSIAQCCNKNNVIFVGGETAEMPDVYHEKAVDVAGFILGVVEKDNLIDGKRVKEGNVLIGLESTGLHSNGYSLVRKLIRNKELNLTAEIASMLMTPHRNYLKTTAAVMEKYRINGIAHITGGSFRKNMPRILPKGLGAEVSRGSWQPLPIFGIVQKAGSIAEEEMYSTFNMGIGYVYVIDKSDADGVLQQLQRLREKAYTIGKVVKGEGVKFVD